MIGPHDEQSFRLATLAAPILGGLYAKDWKSFQPSDAAMHLEALLQAKKLLKAAEEMT